MDAMRSGEAMSIAAGFDNVLVGFVEPVGELVLAQIFPDVLGGIEFRRVGRQDDRRDVLRHDKVLAVMPARAIEDKRGMRAGRDGFGAAREGYSVLYTRLSRLLDDFAVARLGNGVGRLMRKVTKVSVLILDDWAMID